MQIELQKSFNPIADCKVHIDIKERQLENLSQILKEHLENLYRIVGEHSRIDFAMGERIKNCDYRLNVIDQKTKQLEEYLIDFAKQRDCFITYYNKIESKLSIKMDTVVKVLDELYVKEDYIATQAKVLEHQLKENVNFNDGKKSFFETLLNKLK